MRGSGCAERRQHERAGDRGVGGDGQGVAGAVIEPGQDLDVGAFLDASDAAAVADAAGAVVEAVVGEVLCRRVNYVDVPTFVVVIGAAERREVGIVT
ncbi:MAG: hypothetical protein NVS3B26_18240 [Mycobacteriales bacterium]